MNIKVPTSKATFTPVPGSASDAIVVHFNPVSLQYAVSSTIKEEGSGKTKKQYLSQVTGKLTMDLIFDNTHNGENVQVSTSKLAKLMGSAQKADRDKKQIPPIVLFEWGGYKFQGMMEAYKETLDFFSPEGVPLRASVNLTLVQQDKVFESRSASTGGTLTPDTVNVPAGPNQSPQSMANQGGDPGAARALAAMNGEESMRFSAGASLTVSGSVQLGPPVAFASGGAGIGIGGGVGIGISGGAGVGVGGGAGISIGGGAGVGIGGGAGIGIGASAGLGIGGAAMGGSASFGGAAAGINVSGGAGFGVSGSLGISDAGASASIASAGGNIFGASASAGVSVSEGAFAALRTVPPSPPLQLATSNFLPPAESLVLTTDRSTGFQVGGKATIEGPSGLSADVGATADLRARIQFEG